MKSINVANNEAKKANQETRFKASDEAYSKLGMKDRENNIYKLAKAREMKTRDLKCVKWQ